MPADSTGLLDLEVGESIWLLQPGEAFLPTSLKAIFKPEDPQRFLEAVESGASGLSASEGWAVKILQGNCDVLGIAYAPPSWLAIPWQHVRGVLAASPCVPFRPWGA